MLALISSRAIIYVLPLITLPVTFNYLGAERFGMYMAVISFAAIYSLTEGGIEEKTWKSYQKGDVWAFTRRLVEMGDKMPVDKIREKYTSDSEFRNYVGRFVRQFEEVYDQALTNDHGDLLGATFMSSDVGKLYQMLCATTGRETKKPRDGAGRKAA